MQHKSMKDAVASLGCLAAVTALSFSLSNAASAAAVGEIVLVGGNCPGGFIPVDGRRVLAADYPELSSVLGVDDEQYILLPDISPRVSVDPNQENQDPATSNVSPQRELKFVVKPTRDYAVIDPGTGIGQCPTKGCTTNPNQPIILNPGQGNDRDAGAGRDLGSLSPQYCIAAGGDTPPLIEVGLAYEPDTQELVFSRVNVSGYSDKDLPRNFLQGDIDLGQLIARNPDIGRPNLAFVLVGENVCAAKFVDAQENEIYYPGELRLSGVQIAKRTSSNKEDLVFGDDFREQSALVAQGDFSQANFAYNNQRDEDGNPGFLAVDIIDDRKLILETRNQTIDEFNYRVQAQCGDPGSAFNVYYDPSLKGNGNGIDDFN